MGDPGRYLSSFVDAYHKERALGETIRRGDTYETQTAFRIKDYLDGLERENQAQATLGQIIKNRQAPPPGAGPAMPPAPGAGQAIPPPPEGPPPPAPPGPAVGPVAAGGMAALNQMPGATAGMTGAPPMRGAVADDLMQGITPEAQAQFMTSQTGRSTWPSIEKAERERRQAEDRQDAEKYMTLATQAVQEAKPEVWADNMAAFYRRVGRNDLAARYMEYSAKIRTDKKEEEQAPKDFEAIFGAIHTWERDPTPANFGAITTAMSEATSMTAKALSREVMKNAISKRLSGDPDENALFSHIGTRVVKDGMPQQQAWEEAIQKYPAGVVKIWQRSLISPDKVKLPDEFYKAMRLEPPLPFKGNETIGQRAYLTALSEMRQQGGPIDPLQFTRRWNDIEAKMMADRKEELRTPEQIEKDKRDAAKHVQDMEKGKLDIESKKLAIEKKRREEELKKNPKLATPHEISLEIQRLSRDLSSDTMSDEEKDAARQSLAFWRGLRQAKEKELGGPGPIEPGSPEDRKRKVLGAMKRLFPRKRPEDLTPEQKQRVMDAAAE